MFKQREIYRNRERERGSSQLIVGLCVFHFQDITVSHGFEDMLHSPGLPTVQHHHSNNTPLMTSKLQVNPVYMSVCVFVSFASRGMCFCIERAPCGVSCS